MNNRETLEEALSNIRDEYILESMESGNKESVNKHSFRSIPKVAAAALAFVLIGTASAIAATYAPKLKDTTVKKNMIYSGGFDGCTQEDKAEDSHFVGRDEVVSSETELADGEEIVPWMEKTEESYSDGEKMIKYLFSDYATAIDYFEISSCFSKLPGDAQSVEASYWSHSDVIKTNDGAGDIQYDLIVTGIKSDYKMNGGTYALQEYYVVGAVAENAFIAQNLYETQNERIYVNQNGITLTLVDGYEEEAETGTVAGMVTKVLLNYDHYMGAITFSGMNEKDIQRVLDSFDIPDDL